VVDLYCGYFPKIIEYLVDGKGGPLLWKAFSQIRFFFLRRSFIRLYTPSLGKACPFTLENHIHVKALKMQGVPYNYIDALLNPCQKTAPKHVFNRVSHQ